MGRVESNLITDLPSAEKYFSSAVTLYMQTGDEQKIAWAWGALYEFTLNGVNGRSQCKRRKGRKIFS